MGGLTFASPLLLAPMSGICNRPFRLLMEDLGAGGTVSELISCHGINYANQRTLDMLKIDPLEKNMGLQLFGEDPMSMAKAAQTCVEYGPKFIDINMGCPVRKVVSKGGGSALLKDVKTLVPFLKEIKKAIPVPLTIKIRMGWDADQINALEIVKIAADCGVEFVAVHGRTRAQQYSGEADWDYLEKVANKSPLPLIGNGDLHRPHVVAERLQKTQCHALMLGRGAVRNPFIFLESLNEFKNNKENIIFSAEDHWQVVQRFEYYASECYGERKISTVQLKKLLVWFAAGFPHTAKFRGEIFQSKIKSEIMNMAEDYFLGLGARTKQIDHKKAFMMGGHG